MLRALRFNKKKLGTLRARYEPVRLYQNKSRPQPVNKPSSNKKPLGEYSVQYPHQFKESKVKNIPFYSGSKVTVFWNYIKKTFYMH